MSSITKIEAKKPAMIERKKVAAYARVSLDSDRLEHSLSAQISYYSSLIQQNPEWTYAGVYSDNGISGTQTSKRHGFQEMMADAEAGKIDIILTKSISRFARNTVDLLESVRKLKLLGVEVRFEKEHINSLSGDGEVMLSILASFAEEESKSVSSNLKWAFQKKFERGEQWHTAAFGYRWDGKTFVIEEAEAAVVREVYKQFLADVPIKRIARWVNEHGYPEKSNVWVAYALQNEVYAGNVILQKYFTPDPLTHQAVKNTGELPRYLVEGNHEPIVPKEVWQAVQDKIREAKEYNPTVHRMVKPSCFAGKIICCRCGNHYVKGMTKIARADGLKESWVCYGKIKNGKSFCPSLSIRGDRLRKAAAEAMSMDEFDDRAFTERVEWILTTEGEALEFHFYDGTVKTVPVQLFRADHMTTRDPHMKFPGYEWTQQGYRVIPEEAEMVHHVFELYASGMTLSDIRRTLDREGYRSRLGKLSNKFISRMLDDERYSGRRTLKAHYSGTGKEEVIENDHEAIIEPDLFAKVQELRAISWKKQERRLATVRAKKEAENGNNHEDSGK